MTNPKTKTKTKAAKLAGDAIIGWGTIAAIIGFGLALATSGSSGGLAITLALTIGGLLMVVIGYLKRISEALTDKQ